MGDLVTNREDGSSDRGEGLGDVGLLETEGEADEGFVLFVDDADEGGAESGEVGSELQRNGSRWGRKRSAKSGIELLRARLSTPHSPLVLLVAVPVRIRLVALSRARKGRRAAAAHLARYFPIDLVHACRGRSVGEGVYVPLT